MTRQDPEKKADQTGTDRRPERRDSPERTVAPPIEREHETQAGALEEDERREKERH